MVNMFKWKIHITVSTYERTATVIIISLEFPFLKLNFIHILSFDISYILTNVRTKKEYGIPKISQNVAHIVWKEMHRKCT